jgi:hypothetical protein
MGMFDTFRVVNPADERFKNGSGQALKNLVLQSKDFANELNTYYLYDDQVFEDIRLDEEATESFFIEGMAGSQCLVRTLSYQASKLTGRGRLYAQDKLTKPVLALMPHFWEGHISERWAWCEWDVDFEDGRMVKVVTVKAPTREDLFNEVKADFSACLLDDDHPVAAKHFYDLGLYNKE